MGPARWSPKASPTRLQLSTLRKARWRRLLPEALLSLSQPTRCIQLRRVPVRRKPPLFQRKGQLSQKSLPSWKRRRTSQKSPPFPRKRQSRQKFPPYPRKQQRNKQSAPFSGMQRLSQKSPHQWRQWRWNQEFPPHPRKRLFRLSRQTLRSWTLQQPQRWRRTLPLVTGLLSDPFLNVTDARWPSWPQDICRQRRQATS